jgi:hypothetical protein
MSRALSSSMKDFANRYSYYSTHGSPQFTRKHAESNSRTFDKVKNKCKSNIESHMFNITQDISLDEIFSWPAIEIHFNRSNNFD